MELHQYPRPEDDTGIGIHWVTGFPVAVGIGRVREYWIPELKAMGVKWVKLPNHDGALDLVELLLAEGMMPVVRLFRPHPNPGRLTVRELVYLDALVRAGARYVEFNNEPDRDAEWKGGRQPLGALNVVVEDTIANLEAILERGGYPGLPALSGGGKWDLVGKIVERGRRDLLDGPVWQAVHNYPRNRPLDYPYDIGNQEGAAFTERFYQVVGEEHWGEDAWRGRTLYEVNRLRLGRANPGMTIADDHDCWLAYKHYDALNQRHLGRSLPILATEGGYIVGEDVDPRYPATTPDLHMAQTLEVARIMMGTSQRFEPAPDCFFCTAFWLLANRQLGSSSDWWEGQAWYSDRWPGGALPIVRALRAEPKLARRWRSGAGTARVALRGTVFQAGPVRDVLLEQHGQVQAKTTLDANDQFVFTDLVPGVYTIRLPDAGGAQDVELTADHKNVVMNFDLSGTRAADSNSSIVGTVRGGAGAVVMLVRAADGEEWVTLAREDGRFKFVDLTAGLYSARVHPEGSRVENIKLGGRDEVRIELAVAGWGHTVTYRDDDPRARAGAVRCTVDGYAGVQVVLQGAGWQGEPVTTGSAPEHGSYACELAGAEPGDYLLLAQDVPDPSGGVQQLEARIQVDRKRLPEVLFVHSEVRKSPRKSASVIAGTVQMARGARIQPTVVLLDAQANRQTQIPGADGAFEFQDLPPGRYVIQVDGYEDATRQADITLDGANRVDLELTLPLEPRPVGQPAAGLSALTGYVPNASGGLVTAVDAIGNEYTRLVETDGRFRLDHLPAGIYSLTVEGGYELSELELDGRNGLDVTFSPLIPKWAVEVSNGGGMPGFGLLRVEVEGKLDCPVAIWRADGEPVVARTGSGPDGKSAEFAPLEAGAYMVEPDGLDVRTEVELSGLDAVWVYFRRAFVPLNPHLVRRTTAATHGRGPATGATVPVYLFFGRGLFTAQEIRRVVEYAHGSPILVGSDVEEAVNAARVALIGDVDEDVLAELRRHDVNVLTWPWPALDDVGEEE